METRKRRATELIEKCDIKISTPFIERTSVVQIYDRKVKIELGESVLANTSLYSLLRAWVQDDPDKTFVNDMRVRKIRNVTANSLFSEIKVINTRNPLVKMNADHLEEIEIKDYIKSFKDIRHRSRVLAANKYARSICSLDEKTIPRLMTMEKILRDQEYSLSYKQEEENTSRSNEFDSE